MMRSMDENKFLLFWVSSAEAAIGVHYSVIYAYFK